MIRDFLTFMWFMVAICYACLAQDAPKLEKRVLDGGGYHEKKYWKHPFVMDGRMLSWEDGRSVRT